MKRHKFLRGLHRSYRPRTYLEVGINDGRSLALSRVKSIGIDPEFEITWEIQTEVTLVKATSDDYFRRDTALGSFPDRLIDFGFIDGMHLFEFALRDFINVERFSRWTSLIVFDDMLPRDVDEAARDRHTPAWAGDVFKMAEVLRDHRPDLLCVPVDTYPTGLLLVFGADPENQVLRSQYNSIFEQHVVADPQAVPDSVLRRHGAVKPETFLQADFWASLVRARDGEPGAAQSWEQLRPEVEAGVSAALGAAVES